MVELSVLGARQQETGEPEAAEPAEATLDLARDECRLAPRQHQLCYWFHLGARLGRQIRGSPDVSARESLVEAELHAFKLLPERARVSGRSAGCPANLGALTCM